MTREAQPAVADEVARPPVEAAAPGPARVGLLLGAIVVLGVALRIAYNVQIARHTDLFPDSSWYHLQALNIRAGRGYLDIGRQYAAARGYPELVALRDTAYWPPLFPAFLAAMQTLFGESVRVSQLAGCASGAATIALTGLLGRSIAGHAVGLLAALLVALSPFLIAVDGSLMSETLYLPLVLLALLLAQRARRHPTASAWCALGATIGLAALARGDALFLIVVAAIPAAILARVPARQLLPRVLAGLGVRALVIAPWIVRNAIEVGTPTLSTVSANGVLAAGNCSATYEGVGLGAWNRPCMQPGLAYRMSERSYSDRMRDKGVSFAFHHVDRWPVVVAARLGRVWGLWDPVDLTRRAAQESRNRSWEWLVWPTSLLTLAVGLLGFRVLAKQKRPIAMLVAPLVMTTLVAVVTYGNTRFRTATEPALLIGVAAALLAGIRRLRGVSSPDGPHPG